MLSGVNVKQDVLIGVNPNLLKQEVLIVANKKVVVARALEFGRPE